MTELCDFSATELRAMIGVKSVSPVEIMDSCIARVIAVDTALNAVVTPAFAQARNAAKAAEDAVMRGDWQSV
jgi:Asp-tRNA(Asn)/Glu-tRNA(Gln) amidotransferase A subunit family amidase